MNAEFPPDPRYGISTLMGTIGQPGSHIGTNGDLATDGTTGDVYVKTNGVWLVCATGTES